MRPFTFYLGLHRYSDYVTPSPIDSPQRPQPAAGFFLLLFPSY